MNIDVVMPKMGESIQEGTILRWVKNVGDVVERDEVLLEISTDKVDTEVPSPAAGKIVELRAKENDTVEVGAVIAVISSDVNASVNAPAAPVAQQPTPATQQPAPVPVQPAPVPVQPAPVPAQPAPVAAQTAPSAPAAPSAAQAGVEVVMPKMGESIQEGTILRWVKNVGDKVERDEVLLEISTDKVDTEVPSPAEGVLSQILYKEGDVVEVGKVIAILGGAATSSSAKPDVVPAISAQQPAPQAPSSQPTATNGTPKVVSSEAIASASPTSIPRMSGGRFYSPLVRSIASVEGISVEELDSIVGTGLEGRVTKADVLNYLGKRTSPAPATSPLPASAQPRVAVSGQSPVSASERTTTEYNAFPTVGIPITDDIEVIPMDRVRQLIAEHMVRSKHTSPHVTSVAEADVTGIVKLREKVKDRFQQQEGFKLTYTPFFGVATVDAIREFPRINVSVDGKNILQHKKVHLGMATALPDGNLIVPVIKSADQMNLVGIARAMNDLAQRARNKKLAPDDISGGTITITNVGSFGSLFGSPVINQPQTAIIGIGAIQKRPVVREVDGEDLIVIRSMVYLSITYDHRVIDGALATQALAALVRSLERMNDKTVSI